MDKARARSFHNGWCEAVKMLFLYINNLNLMLYENEKQKENVFWCYYWNPSLF